MKTHPVVAKILADCENTDWRKRGGDYSLDVTHAAKLIRLALKRAFPDQKFSVKTKKYSGGSSTTVSWTDGPKGKEVDAVVDIFAGGGFDGMIDLKYHVDHWLMPDGIVRYAHSSGTEGSMGTVAGFDHGKPEGALCRVSLGGDFVFTQREISDATKENTRLALEQLDERQRRNLYFELGFHPDSAPDCYHCDEQDGQPNKDAPYYVAHAMSFYQGVSQ